MRFFWEWRAACDESSSDDISRSSCITLCGLIAAEITAKWLRRLRTLFSNYPRVLVYTKWFSTSISHYLRSKWDFCSCFFTYIQLWEIVSRKLKLHRDSINEIIEKKNPAKSLRPWQKIVLVIFFLRFSRLTLIAWLHLHVKHFEDEARSVC